MEVSKEIREDIVDIQNKLKVAVTYHQLLITKLKDDPDNDSIKFDIKAAQDEIVSIGLDQREILQEIRRKLNLQQTKTKLLTTSNAIEESRNNLNAVLIKAKKPSFIERSNSVSSLSAFEDDSLDVLSLPSPVSPSPLMPHQMSQLDYLSRLGLCTHDLFKELQNKRVERKRRSTANPHFLYGNRWDYTTVKKRKKNAYLMSMSPPNTRQSSKNKLKSEQNVSSPPLVHAYKKPLIGLNIPNLPSGLTIERVNGKQATSDQCLVCRSSDGQLNICETCTLYYHISCHNRPLVQQPRHCPKCINKQERDKDRDRDVVGSLTVPSTMTVLTTYVPAQVKEMAEQKRTLLEKNAVLNEELIQLEERSQQLANSLKQQANAKESMVTEIQMTKQKIQHLLDFITCMKQPARTQTFSDKNDDDDEQNSSSNSSLPPTTTIPPTTS